MGRERKLKQCDIQLSCARQAMDGPKPAQQLNVRRASAIAPGVASNCPPSNTQRIFTTRGRPRLLQRSNRFRRGHMRRQSPHRLPRPRCAVNGLVVMHGVLTIHKRVRVVGLMTGGTRPHVAHASLALRKLALHAPATNMASLGESSDLERALDADFTTDAAHTAQALTASTFSCRNKKRISAEAAQAAKCDMSAALDQVGHETRLSPACTGRTRPLCVPNASPERGRYDGCGSYLRYMCLLSSWGSAGNASNALRGLRLLQTKRGITRNRILDFYGGDRSKCWCVAVALGQAVPNRALGLAMEPAEVVREIRPRLLAFWFRDFAFCPQWNLACSHFGRLVLETGTARMLLRSFVDKKLRTQDSADDHWRPLCDAVVDRNMRRPKMCAVGGDRTLRHHSARNFV